MYSFNRVWEGPRGGPALRLRERDEGMNKIACIVSVVAASLGSVPLADATAYSLPGLSCVGDEIPTSPMIQYGGQLSFNTSTVNALGVWCPILRQTPDLSNISSVFVAVGDGANNASVTCSIQSCNTTQTSCTNSAFVSSSSGGTGRSELNLGSIAGQTNGSAAILCSLPKITNNQASSIYQYRWVD